jgi:uncharacterized protein (UPF0335 family)
MNTPYKFPDEIQESEKEVSPEQDEADEKLVIEIEDDTPEQDRNKESLPEKVKQELYEDELEDYSTKVRKKLIQMKKLAHDERREKEAAMREQQEALSFAQKMLEENKRLKSNLNNSEKNVLATVTQAVQMELDAAKKAYREAYDSGDTDRVLEAQDRLTDAKMKADKVRNFRPQPLQEQETVVQTAPQAQPQYRPDPTAQQWQQNNPWFGEDEEMTSLALGLHEKLKREGVAVSSQEYYRRIDQTIRKRFPERFEAEQEPEERSEKRTKPSSVVAPATRTTSSKRIKLNTSQQNIAKKLGLTHEQYALEVSKMEA